MRTNVGLSLIVALLVTHGQSANAQQAANVPRIGLLASASPSSYSARMPAFEKSLRDRGYKSIVIERRYADGKSDRLPDLAAQLVDLKVDVILATSDPSVPGLRKRLLKRSRLFS